MILGMKKLLHGKISLHSVTEGVLPDVLFYYMGRVTLYDMGQFRVTLHILKILQHLLDHPDTEHYGLELARATGIARGALFPALDRLSKAGYLTSALEDIDESAAGRRKRRYFHLTSSGVEFAHQQLKDAPGLRSRHLQPVMGGAS